MLVTFKLRQRLYQETRKNLIKKFLLKNLDGYAFDKNDKMAADLQSSQHVRHLSEIHPEKN